MRKVIVLKKSLSILAIVCLVIGLMPITHITDVFADEDDGTTETQATEQPSDNGDDGIEEQSSPTEMVDEEEQSAEETQAPTEESADDQADESEEADATATDEDPVGEESTEEPAEEPTDDEPLVEETLMPDDAALMEEPTQEDEIEITPVAEEQESNNDAGGDAADITEPAQEDDEDLTDVVDTLNEGEFVLENSEGEVIPLASNEASEVLNSNAPFFWNSATNQWEGYTTDGTGCPSNVACFAATNPFQAAVDVAPEGSTIYVAQNTYDEDVILNTADLSFVAFSSIESRIPVRRPLRRIVPVMRCLARSP